MNPLRILAVAAAVAIVPLAGCTDSLNGSNQGTVQMQMTDSPADFEAVNIVVTEVALHRAGAPDSSGWEKIKDSGTTYNLMQLRNGVYVTLGTGSVPAGQYTQIRMKFGSGSNVVVAGLPLTLALSSEAQAGFRINGSWEVKSGERLDLALDFDAGRSIELTSVGHYTLRPFIRAVAMDKAGWITGTVKVGANLASDATVTAMQGSQVVASSETSTDGKFTISALPTGTYKLVVHAASAAYADSTYNSLTVNARSATSIGVVVLSPNS